MIDMGSIGLVVRILCAQPLTMKHFFTLAMALGLTIGALHKPW